MTTFIVIFNQSHELNLKADKAEYNCFAEKNDTRNNSSDKITVGGNSITKRLEWKYLGVLIDSDLSFEGQVKKVLQKMAIGIKPSTRFAISFPLNI